MTYYPGNKPKARQNANYSHGFTNEYKESTAATMETLIDINFGELNEVKNKYDLPIYHGLTNEELQEVIEEFEKRCESGLAWPNTEDLTIDLGKREDTIKMFNKVLKNNQKFLRDLARGLNQECEIAVPKASQKEISSVKYLKQSTQSKITSFLQFYLSVLNKGINDGVAKNLNDGVNDQIPTLEAISEKADSLSRKLDSLSHLKVDDESNKFKY